MAPDGSVTRCVRDLEGGVRREAAVRDLWDRFYGELTRHALRKLRAAHADRLVADEEDAAERAFTKVCRGIETGRLRLERRDDLRRVLLSQAALEAVTLLRH